MSKSKSRLGRGLGSLISKGTASTSNTQSSSKTPSKSSSKKASAQKTPAKKAVSAAPKAKAPAEDSPYRDIPVKQIERNPYQPRHEFNEDYIKELAASIKSEGLLQPVVVRTVEGDKFQLIAGERRLRAFKHLGYAEIPARVIKATDASSATISLIENLQRQDLNPIDEALGYSSLMNDFDLTQEEVSRRIGRARASIANSLRLLNLDAELQGYLKKGLLSMGHAKALLGVEDAAQRQLLARRIIQSRLSVREAEELVKQFSKATTFNPTAASKSATQAAVIKDLQKHLSHHLNTEVMLSHNPKKGKIVINYRGNDDLHRILDKIGFTGSRTITAA